MGRSGIVTALALTAMAIVNGASADTKTLARAGSWEAFGGTTSTGRGVCGISAEAEKRYFGVKFFAGNDTFTIQLGTPAWTVANSEQVGITMRLDANPIWRATAAGFHFDDGDAGLQFTINRAELDNFSREFRDSSQLRLQFQEDRFPQWIMGLEGTMAVNSAFQTCLSGLR
jgi:hypothetical protein